MLPVFVYKIICVLSLYFAFASYAVKIFFGAGTNPYAAFAVCVFVSALCFPLRDGWKRLIPLPLLCFIIPFVYSNGQSAAKIIFVALPCAYVIATVAVKRFSADYNAFYSFFVKGAAALGVLFFVAAVNSGNVPAGENFIFILAFLTFGVVLMRTLRQSEEIRKRPAFQLANLSAALAVLAAGLLFNSGAISAAIKFIGRLISFLFSLLPAREHIEYEPPLPDEFAVEGEAEAFESFEPASFKPPEMLDFIFFKLAPVLLLMIFIGLLAAALTVFFRRRRLLPVYSDAEYAELILERKNERKPFKERFTHRGAVRRCYRKFSAKYARRASETTLEIDRNAKEILFISCNNAEKYESPRENKIAEVLHCGTCPAAARGECETPGCAEFLREVYLRARYSSKEITKRDAAEARKCLRVVM